MSSIRRRLTCTVQVAEEREELLYNKLVLLEHELKSYIHDIVRKARDLSDTDSIRDLVKLVDVEVSSEDNYWRYSNISVSEIRLDNDVEPLIDNDARRVENEEEAIEEYYVGQKMVEKLLISSW